MKRTETFVIPAHESPELVASLADLARPHFWCAAHRGGCSCVWASIGSGPTVRRELYLSARDPETRTRICRWLKDAGHDCGWMLAHKDADFLVWWSAISISRGGGPVEGVVSSWEEYADAVEHGRLVAFAGIDVDGGWVCEAPELPESRWFQPESQLEALLLFGDPSTEPRREQANHPDS